MVVEPIDPLGGFVSVGIRKTRLILVVHMAKKSSLFDLQIRMGKLLGSEFLAKPRESLIDVYTLDAFGQPFYGELPFLAGVKSGLSPENNFAPLDGFQKLRLFHFVPLSVL